MTVVCPTEDVNEGVLGHDFVLHIRDSVRRQISLPASFSAIVSEQGLDGLWLRFQGYPYCPFWVMLHIEGSTLVFLEDGWKAFAR